MGRGISDETTKHCINVGRAVISLMLSGRQVAVKRLIGAKPSWANFQPAFSDRVALKTKALNLLVCFFFLNTWTM